MKKSRLLTVLLLTAVISAVSLCLAAYADEHTPNGSESVECIHEWGEWSYSYDEESQSYLIPTCTEDGLAIYTCSLCGKEEERIVPAEGHSLHFLMNKLDPTCTSTGTGVNRCDICFAEIEFEIPTTSHSYGEPVISGSCTEPAAETYTCTVCGNIKTVQISSAPGHLWGKWDENQPSCDKEGEKIRYCTICNESDTEIIPAAEHDWASWNEFIAPGCTTDGKDKRICMNCRSFETRSTAPLGHSWGEWNIITASGCTTEGERTHTCKRCSVIENEITPADGHAWSDWQTLTAPTYLEEGNKIRYCAVCNENENAVIAQKKNPFDDVKADKWYTTPILYCLQYEYMVGVSDTGFSLSQPVTRAMIVQIMAKIAGADLNAAEYQSCVFNDVADGKWYTSAVAWANKNGLASGIGEGQFGYKNSITREELAVFLMKLTEHCGYSATVRGALNNGYKDTDRIHSWAYEALDWALTSGVMHGSTPQHVSPRIPLTRAQVAEIVYGYCTKVLGK
ncbi:MAG: S-layer homology domain-containing protein [Clostridia bacterium]|nr:S-layer homology domain-containing protein [Clostridia bacterium]